MDAIKRFILLPLAMHTMTPRGVAAFYGGDGRRCEPHLKRPQSLLAANYLLEGYRNLVLVYLIFTFQLFFGPPTRLCSSRCFAQSRPECWASAPSSSSTSFGAVYPIWQFWESSICNPHRLMLCPLLVCFDFWALLLAMDFCCCSCCWRYTCLLFIKFS